MSNEPTDWETRLATADASIGTTQEGFEQIVRAARAAGLSINAIAHSTRSKNVSRIMAILGTGADGVSVPTAPALTPVVYLRGFGNQEPTWDRVRNVMHARGWATVSDKTSAWHLARGGTPVVRCDFSTDLDRTELPWFGYDLYVIVGRVTAKNVKPEYADVGTVGAALPTSEYVRLLHEGAEWLDTLVAWSDSTTPELVMLNGGDHPRPKVRTPGGEQLDENRLALWVEQALGG